MHDACTFFVTEEKELLFALIEGSREEIRELTAVLRSYLRPIVGLYLTL